MSTRLVRLGLALSVILGFAACGNTAGDDTPPADDTGDDTPGNPDARPNPGTPDAPMGACANIAGAWSIEGGCGDDNCTFTQAGCAITQVDCTSGAHSTSGSLTTTSFTYTGVSGGGVPATCNGVISGNAMTGTCDIAGVGTCDFNGSR